MLWECIKDQFWDLALVPDISWSERGYETPALPPPGDMFLRSALCTADLRQQKDIRQDLDMSH